MLSNIIKKETLGNLKVVKNSIQDDTEIFKGQFSFMGIMEAMSGLEDRPSVMRKRHSISPMVNPVTGELVWVFVERLLIIFYYRSP